LKNLDNLREEIDKIDKEMISLFQKRMDIVIKIGEYKKSKSLPIEDKERERQLLEKNLNYCTNPNYIPYTEEFIISLMKISKRLQSEIY